MSPGNICWSVFLENVSDGKALAPGPRSSPGFHEQWFYATWNPGFSPKSSMLQKDWQNQIL
jgi:hypothetical protein